MLLLLFDGLLLFRFAERQFWALLFQLPPRNKRFDPVFGSHPLLGEKQVPSQGAGLRLLPKPNDTSKRVHIGVL